MPIDRINNLTHNQFTSKNPTDKQLQARHEDRFGLTRTNPEVKILKTTRPTITELP